MKIDEFIISGVYKITNIVTGQFYIGCSRNIYDRWNQHVQRYIRENRQYSQKPLYIAMRKYGVDKFNFEILKTVDNQDDLLIEEALAIEDTKAYKFGYNHPDKHQKAFRRGAISKSDVMDIRKRYANHELFAEVYRKYAEKISKEKFKGIWEGKQIPNIMPKVYSMENRNFHAHMKCNGNRICTTAKLNRQDIISIRMQQINGKKAREVYQEFCDKISYAGFRNVWDFRSWKSVMPEAQEHKIKARTSTEKDVKYIRQRRIAGKSKHSIYKEFASRLTYGNFEKIWYGYSWKHIMPEAYVCKNKSVRVGESNSNSKMTENEVRIIRQRKNNGEKSSKIYKDFSVKISYPSFRNIWNNKTWRHVTA